MTPPALPPWEQRAPQPDRFPEPAQSTEAHPVADPASMTGGPPLTRDRDDHGRAAGHELLAAQRREVDSALSAALARWVQNRRGRLVTLNGTGVADAAGIAVIDLDGPKIGYVWNLRRLNVGPNDYLTARPYPLGLTIFATTGTLPPGQPYPTLSALQVISSTAKFPAEGTWSETESPISPGEHLLVIIVGANQGDLFSIGGRAVELAAAVGEIYGPMR